MRDPAMRGTVAVVAVVLAVVFNVAGGVGFGEAGIKPDLVLVVVLCLSLLERRTTAIGAGLLAGFLLDLLSGRAIGLNLAVMGAVSSVVSAISNHVYRDSTWVAILAMLAATLFAESVRGLVFAWAGIPMDIATAVRAVILPSLLLNSIITLPAFCLSLWYARWSGLVWG